MSDISFDEFDSIEVDETALAELDQLESMYAAGYKLPPKTFTTSNPALKQRDLFGGTIAARPAPVPGPSRTSVHSKSSFKGEEIPTAKVKIVKKWDPACFAKHGWSKKNALTAKNKAKGKRGKTKLGNFSTGDDWDEEEVLEDEQDDSDGEPFLVDTSYDPKAPLLPIKWPPDPEASQSWVYPVQADKPLRTYQYNIVHKALFENTLVSLPTGLGKTFIAACVMLNFFRWYPQSKIIFMAPSRPLVRQQIIACHYIAGIPQSACVELTGMTAPKLRAVAWATKRVIYSTPQTVENDLAKGRLDPRDVTCLVVDEAHRASGDYSYCGVVRYLMSRNPHFRVLALTATPGSKGEAVQGVIDNLHIGNIQVRTDTSFDIIQYIHKKSYDLLVLPLGPGLTRLRDAWANLMQPYQKQCLASKLIYDSDPNTLSPYSCQMGMQKIGLLPGGKAANGKFYGMLKVLGSMARAMEYLIIQSVSEFDNQLKELRDSGPKQLVTDNKFIDLVRTVNELRARPNYVGHPKMEKLREMCLEHFKRTENDLDELTGEKRETRVMVFCNYRAVVEELVQCLNTQRPIIKATAFVGQSAARGQRGMSQKDQIETIRNFKRGQFNVLVASSIGEEGLDIGEIDLIVCYEANKSPIRMLQRVGRTGRARDGHIIVLMTEGREAKNWDKAQDAYQDVQNALVSNKVFELYADGDRMLPEHVKPQVDKQVIVAQELDYSTMTMNAAAATQRRNFQQEKKEKKERKEKKEIEMKAKIPEDAFLGFRTVGEIVSRKKSNKGDSGVPSPPPSPSPAEKLRIRKKAALLTEEEENYMRERWYNQGAVPVKFTGFNFASVPFVLGETGSALTIPRHGNSHLQALKALTACQELADPIKMDSWHEQMSNAFDPNLIQPWQPAVSAAPHVPKRAYQSLKRVPIISSSPQPSFPAILPPATLLPPPQPSLPESEMEQEELDFCPSSPSDVLTVSKPPTANYFSNVKSPAAKRRKLAETDSNDEEAEEFPSLSSDFEYDV